MEAFGYGAATQSTFELVNEDVLLSLGLSKNPQEILSAEIYLQPIQGRPLTCAWAAINVACRLGDLDWERPS